MALQNYLQIFLFSQLEKNLEYISSLSNSRRHSANADVIADVKSKIIVSRWHFFANVIFSTTWNVPNYHKIPIPKQIRTHYTFQRILNIFSNTCALPFIFNKLQTTEKLWSFLSIVTFCHVLFLIEIRYNQFRVGSYNHLALILRHYCSVSYRNSMQKMQITGNVLFFRAYDSLPFAKYLRRIYFCAKIFPGNLLLRIGSRKLQISGKVFCQYKSEI